MRIIKIGAEWCGPCKVMDKRLENIEAKTGCKVTRYMADSEDEETLNVIEKYEVTNIPVTVLLDDNDNVIERWSGLVTEDTIISKMNF